MSGVEMHSCVTRKPPRGVQSTFPAACASRETLRSNAAAVRATKPATACTHALSRYSGDAAVNTTRNAAVSRTKRRVGCGRSHQRGAAATDAPVRSSRRSVRRIHPNTYPAIATVRTAGQTYTCSTLNHAGDAAARPSVPIRTVLKPMISATPPAAPASRLLQATGYARIAARQNANASVPLHDSVASTGEAGAPNHPTAIAACACVNGSTACASVQLRRDRPKSPTLQATPRSAKLTAAVRPRAVSVGTSDLLYGDVLRAQGSTEIVDRLEAFQPRGARKDINVDGSGFRPSVQYRVRFGEDEHAGETGAGEDVGDPVDDGRPRATKGGAEGRGDRFGSECREMGTLGEVDGVQSRRSLTAHPPTA